MNKGIRFCLRMLKIGCIGFGGGSALIPVLEQEFVDKDNPESSAEFEKDVIVASLTPGALPVEIASSIGKREIGFKGSILGSTMMALPGAMISLLFFLALSRVSQSALRYVKVISVGVSAFIICLLLDYIFKTIVDSSDNRNRFIKVLTVIFGVSFLVCGSNIGKLTGGIYKPFFGVSTVSLLLAAFFFYFYTRKGMSFLRIICALTLTLIFLLGHGKAGLLKDSIICKTAGVLMLVLSAYSLATDADSKTIHFPNLRSVLIDIAV